MLTPLNVVLVFLVLILLGVLPAWPYSRNYGWGPSGIVGVLLAILIILMVLGHLPY